MTIAEAKYTQGVRVIRASSGDSLLTLSRRLYPDDVEKGILLLQHLNQRFDWTEIKPGDSISYFAPNVIDSITELW